MSITFEEVSDEEFNSLPNKKTAAPKDEQWTRILNSLGEGKSVRIPVTEEWTVGSLNRSIGRRVSREFKGFKAILKADPEGKFVMVKLPEDAIQTPANGK